MGEVRAVAATPAHRRQGQPLSPGVADTGRGCDRVLPDVGLRGQIEMAEAVALIVGRQPPAEAMPQGAHAGQERCEDVAGLLGLPLARTSSRSCSRLIARMRLARRRRGESGCCWCAATTELNEVKAGKVPGLRDGFGSRRGRDPRCLRLSPGYLGRSYPAAGSGCR